jgi:hypothetical protein
LRTWRVRHHSRLVLLAGASRRHPLHDEVAVVVTRCMAETFEALARVLR